MPLKIYQRGGVWHYRGTISGRRLRGSTGTQSKDIAEQIKADIEAKAFKGNLYGPASVLTFARAAILYRNAGRSTRFLDKIERHWKETLVKDITAGAIRTAALELYPKAGAATRNRQVIVPTQAVINHAAESDLCPAIRVKRFKVDAKVKTPATREWVESFAAHANPQLAALAYFMFATGARVSEALAVQWDDVDLKARTVLIRQTKIKVDRKAHLPQAVIVAMANVPKLKDRGVFLYATPTAAQNGWYAAIGRAKIARLSFHCCRHGFATSLLRAGVDPVTIAKLGGWQSAALVLSTYGRANDDPTITDRLFSAETDTGRTQGSKKGARKLTLAAVS
jgi:integrase